jgi:hypothetical protein
MGFLQWVGLLAVMGITGWLTWTWQWPTIVVAIAVMIVGASYIAWIGKRNDA